MMVLEDDSPVEAASTPSTPRNLSAWNITIPYIDFYDDDVKRERIPVFCIDVERNDRKAGEAERTFCLALCPSVYSERGRSALLFEINSCGILFL